MVFPVMTRISPEPGGNPSKLSEELEPGEQLAPSNRASIGAAVTATRSGPVQATWIPTFAVSVVRTDPRVAGPRPDRSIRIVPDGGCTGAVCAGCPLLQAPAPVMSARTTAPRTIKDEAITFADYGPVARSKAGLAESVRIVEHMFVTSAHILHADLDSFFASVEQRDKPWLRGKPVIVGGGVVLAASYEAKAYGIHSATGGRAARALCPQAIVVQPRFEAYSQASKDVFAIFRDTTPLVEGISIDEAFLDVGGLAKVSGTPAEIATRLRARVRDDVGLAITIGVACTKFLAKVASGVGKPDGLLVVEAGRELEFLHPLPVERLWGVGKVTAAKLHDRGIFTVGEVAGLDRRTLVSMLGIASGRHLHALANNRDPRPVRVGQRRRSIGSQRALGQKRRTEDELDAMLAGLVDRVARRLRSGERMCRTVVLRLRFGDWTRATRSHTLATPSDNTEALLSALRTLLTAAMPMIRDRNITLIGVSLAGLDGADTYQLELPFDRPSEAPHALDTALDTIRERYGTSAVTRAVLLGKDPGMSMPTLPD